MILITWYNTGMLDICLECRGSASGPELCWPGPPKWVGLELVGGMGWAGMPAQE